MALAREDLIAIDIEAYLDAHERKSQPLDVSLTSK